ncbi:acyl-CoA carboxylase subunit beta [Limnobacter litoralis]|uniref:Acetyl-CoA carboxylase carboxyltransferase subunit n=1 Tax=Limnobacter litoralis TaxID=481366 RepID=A0ABQ5YLG8_9BURK|nr:carboxyl transferase domain-containing protein [Limnobacter litoralis]GLR25404.1 acetyl-CoA carboxylase carboxyltransferase subunit [Limnobacter litoralis]
MPKLDTAIAASSEAFKTNAQHMEQALATLRELERRTREASAKSAPSFAKRGQLMPRERLALLIDPGSPFLELSTLAGYMQDGQKPEKSIPGGGIIAGLAYVANTLCMVVASDSGIEAGALQAMGIEKMQRAQDIALENRLPFINLGESAGANLLKYKVEHFVLGGGNFYRLAKLSAAGLPVVNVLHGSSTAGGAYIPGLSDVVIMVRERARAFLAGPPLLKAATGEIATDEELGGAEMHCAISGLGDYLAEDDRHAIAIAREVMEKMDWNGSDRHAIPRLNPDAPAPAYSADELLGIMPADIKTPVDMREVIARIVDASDFLEFKAGYGSATLCGYAKLMGVSIGIITNLGPIDTAGATKATHFIQSCCQTRTPIIYLQNTTGYMVGKDAEQGGIIKHGSKMIQAVSNATVPQITVLCGASFGAGNYGMCGRAFGPRFVFAWPNSKTAVMGAEQAAGTMATVMQASAARKGMEVPEFMLDNMKKQIVDTFESQTSAFYTSGLLLDDGVIDPRDTRQVLAMALAASLQAERSVQPMQFGVARP